MLDQQKLLQLKKKDGNDPVISLQLGKGEKTDQELDSSERKRWEGSCGWAEGENGVGQILHFLMFFSSFPNGGPVLNSVVNLWGFCWGVWRLSGSLGVGSGSWKDLQEEGRDSNWLCAEGSVCWRGRCGGFAMAQHWGRPTLWGPEGILASAEDCHLEESLNCFLKKLVYLWWWRGLSSCQGCPSSGCRWWQCWTLAHCGWRWRGRKNWAVHQSWC